MARRPGQLTEEDELKLLCQGVSIKSHKELDILKARYTLDKDCTLVKVKSGESVSCKDVMSNMRHLLSNTENDGGEDMYFYLL